MNEYRHFDRTETTFHNLTDTDIIIVVPKYNISIEKQQDNKEELSEDNLVVSVSQDVQFLWKKR